MNVSIGVILFNPDKNVLQRVEKYSEISNDVILYDNSEEINLVSQELSRSYDNYISNGRNNGLSEAIKFFFEKASDLGSDLLLTMDQDSDFSNSEIIKMIKLIEEENDEDYILYCPNYRKVYLDGSNSKVLGPSKIKNTENKSTDFAMTSGSFFKMKFKNEFFPISNLFIGYVDHEICFNILRNKKKIKMIGDIIFNQEVGTLVKTTSYNKFFHIVRHSSIRYQYMIRNNLYLEKNFFSDKSIQKKLKKDRLRLMANIILGEKNKIAKLRSYMNGYKDFSNEKFGKIDVGE